jgi:hypothetical protein
MAAKVAAGFGLNIAMGVEVLLLLGIHPVLNQP